MVKAVIINGGNDKKSRVNGVHDYVEAFFNANEVDVSSIYVHDLPAIDLITANYTSKDIIRTNEKVADASIVVVLTPIYKASYSGILKTYLDLLPQKGLENKTIIPIAVGGSIGHLLAVEYALKPVLSVLGATEIFNTVYVVDQQINRLENNRFELNREIVFRLKNELQKITTRNYSLSK
ncbi:NADPH-dependent FMN reductase [Rummeliibacillus pycnus]|uniref:NADPH-dependent FMN reductase n=1 Tax=Rummeliibacillus pycnus TaxID=101070 RepID=UPI000C9D12F8|nr:NADPH-dependent FMN reductase [Rummeliibacillus pycnus]